MNCGNMMYSGGGLSGPVTAARELTLVEKLSQAEQRYHETMKMLDDTRQRVANLERIVGLPPQGQ